MVSVAQVANVRKGHTLKINRGYETLTLAKKTLAKNYRKRFELFTLGPVNGIGSNVFPITVTRFRATRLGVGANFVLHCDRIVIRDLRDPITMLAPIAT